MHSFLSLSNNFCLGMLSKDFLKSTEEEKNTCEFRCFCVLDFTDSSRSILEVKML